MKLKINKTLIYSFLIVKNLSIEEFCYEVDIDKNSFDKFLKGEASLQTIFKMVNFMKVKVADITVIINENISYCRTKCGNGTNCNNLSQEKACYML